MHSCHTEHNACCNGHAACAVPVLPACSPEPPGCDEAPLPEASLEYSARTLTVGAARLRIGSSAGMADRTSDRPVSSLASIGVSRVEDLAR